jgi:hypothetical protein
VGDERFVGTSTYREIVEKLFEVIIELEWETRKLIDKKLL